MDREMSEEVREGEAAVQEPLGQEDADQQPLRQGNTVREDAVHRPPLRDNDWYGFVRETSLPTNYVNDALRVEGRQLIEPYGQVAVNTYEFLYDLAFRTWLYNKPADIRRNFIQSDLLPQVHFWRRVMTPQDAEIEQEWQNYLNAYAEPLPQLFFDGPPEYEVLAYAPPGRRRDDDDDDGLVGRGQREEELWN